jgi:hypothetical protein
MLFRTKASLTEPKLVVPPLRDARRFLVITSVWAVVTLVKSSNGGGSILFYAFFVFYGGLFWLVSWIYLLALGVVRLRSTVWLKRFSFFVAAQLLVFGFGQWAAQSEVPFRARFFLSRAALERYCTALTSGHMDRSRRYVGLFEVMETEQRTNCVRLITGQVGMGDHIGVVYCPEGKPPRVGEDGYRRLTGPWWIWYQSW